MQTLADFIQEIRQHLATGKHKAQNNNYLDLATISITDRLPEMQLSGYPAGNPFLPVFEIILEQIRECRLDRIQVGLNELLKSCLANLDNDGLTCREAMYRVRLIFERCLQPDFPYIQHIWEYINIILQNFCLYLLRRQKYNDARTALDTLAQLGRMAVQKGLPTATTQSALRLIEIQARDFGNDCLAAQAKNYRFNLEL
ncbi:hypothetical protein [Thermincola ferriacetica]